MVDSKKAPFVPNEEQQEALGKLKEAAHNWALADAAQKEFVKENPRSANEVYALVNSQYQNPAAAQKEAQGKNVPSHIITQTYYGAMEATNESIKKGEYRENITEIKAGWDKKIQVQTTKPDPGIIAEQKEEKAIREARVLSTEEKESLVGRLRIYLTELEIKRSAVESFKEKNPNLYKERIIELNAFIPMGAVHPFTANSIDYPIQAKNGLLQITDKITAEIQEEIKSGKHKERVEYWGNILKSIHSPHTAETLENPEAKKKEEAIKQVQAYAREYEIRYAAVDALTKDSNVIYHSNKIMEFMAIPNPLDSFNRDPQLAKELKKVFDNTVTETKQEILDGKHDKTIEKMKEKLSDSFNAPLKKSKMDFDLPDSARKAVLEVAGNLQAFKAEMPAGNPNLDAVAPRKSSSLML